MPGNGRSGCHGWAHKMGSPAGALAALKVAIARLQIHIGERFTRRFPFNRIRFHLGVWDPAIDRHHHLGRGAPGDLGFPSTRSLQRAGPVAIVGRH